MSSTAATKFQIHVRPEPAGPEGDPKSGFRVSGQTSPEGQARLYGIHTLPFLGHAGRRAWKEIKCTRLAGADEEKV